MMQGKIIFILLEANFFSLAKYFHPSKSTHFTLQIYFDTSGQVNKSLRRRFLFFFPPTKHSPWANFARWNRTRGALYRTHFTLYICQWPRCLCVFPVDRFCFLGKIRRVKLPVRWGPFINLFCDGGKGPKNIFFYWSITTFVNTILRSWGSHVLFYKWFPSPCRADKFVENKFKGQQLPFSFSASANYQWQEKELKLWVTICVSAEVSESPNVF